MPSENHISIPYKVFRSWFSTPLRPPHTSFLCLLHTVSYDVLVTKGGIKTTCSGAYWQNATRVLHTKRGVGEGGEVCWDDLLLDILVGIWLRCRTLNFFWRRGYELVSLELSAESRKKTKEKYWYWLLVFDFFFPYSTLLTNILLCDYFFQWEWKSSFVSNNVLKLDTLKSKTIFWKFWEWRRRRCHDRFTWAYESIPLWSQESVSQLSRDRRRRQIS